ncbi:MAG: hypothetical protein KDD60_10625, partial [Bdellovibrionales bacterium]|nr:hypothetical protein [Bdellovibrionales bacterium]
MKYVSKLASNYQRCATNALYAMKNGWICALAFWVTTLAFNLVSGFMGPLRLGLAGGLVIGMLHLALITYCYRWILLTRDSRWTRLPFKNKVQALSEFDGELFTVIINTAFPIFLAEFALSTLTNGISAASTLPGYLKLAVVFLFNPLPEIIMVSRSRGTQSLMEALQFIKQNV